MAHYIAHPLIKNLKTKLAFLGLTLLFVFSCDNNSRIDCATVVCAQQLLLIELVNEEGTNLITNETYSLENIVVSKDDIQVNDSGNSSTETIIIFISGMEGSSTYEVFLNDSETDILVLNLRKNSPGSDCCSPPFTIEKATYNETDLEIIREESALERIRVVK